MSAAHAAVASRDAATDRLSFALIAGDYECHVSSAYKLISL